MKEKDLDFAIVTMKDGIVRLQFREGAALEIEHVEKIQSTTRELSEGKPYCLLTDARVDMTSSKEARAYGVENEDRKNTKAHAILVNSTALKLMANFFIRFNKPTMPTRLFSSEGEAMEWLKNILWGLEPKNAKVSFNQ